MEQENEYRNRVYHYEIHVKNNIGVPAKFKGSQSEFDIAFKDFIESDTYGKIIGITKHTHEEVMQLNNVSEEMDLDYNPFHLDTKLERSKVNKRYWRFL